MPISFPVALFRFTVAAAVLLLCASFGIGQKYDSIEKGRMKDMLKVIKSDIKSHYFDPEYKGIDLEAKFQAAAEKLSGATSTGQALGIIAQTVIDFNDSHLYFIPPATNLRVDYGWRMSYIGDKCIVTDVKPGSDAEKKGLKPGDEIIAINGFRITRSELWKVQYYYNRISKRGSLVLAVLSPGASSARDIEIASEVKHQPQTIVGDSLFRLNDDFYNEKNDDHRFVKLAGGITVWKMPSWAFDPSLSGNLFSRAANGQSIIMDLRCNGGGYVVNLEDIAGYFVDKDTQIAELKGRKKMDPQVAKTKGSKVFPGKLVILLDSRSGSASEIFARFMQLQKRATVIGDVSAGAVMQSMTYDHDIGGGSYVLFAVSVTNADVIMSDGKSLEHVGVIPDELVLPTPADVAAGRDVVMERAVELLGGKVDPAEAGKWFPYFWKTK